MNCSFYWCIGALCVCLTCCEDDSSGCFCKLQGRIDDCTCNIDTVDYFNNVKIYPRLKSLLIADFFRYIKVNLNHKCPYWADDSRCAIQDCSVQTCPEESLPPGLKGYDEGFDVSFSTNKHLKRSVDDEYFCDENYGGLGAINQTISKRNYAEFQKWQAHDDAEDKFCHMDDEFSTELQYVDLLLNPERYTGYKGFSAHRVWNTIYKENCFKMCAGMFFHYWFCFTAFGDSFWFGKNGRQANIFGAGFGPYSTTKNLKNLCLEKRTFYRAISGLHSSISIHLCSQYYTKAKNSFTLGEWGPNIDEFKRRFNPSTTHGDGPEWLKNLYFIYLLELRALAKAAPYFEKSMFFTGNYSNDQEVREGVKALLEVAKSFPNHFNESSMFAGDREAAKKLKEEFRQHFLNISLIMNCVGCDKCRLWGKIQIQGLGTALKILFSPDLELSLLTKKKKFRLTRTEIVSLFNGFGRLSNSVLQLEKFRRLLNETQ